MIASHLKMERLGPQICLAVKQDGIKAIFLRNVLWAQPVLFVSHQFGIEATSIAACLLAGMLEVEVHQVLIASEHLVAELLLIQTVHPLIGHDGILADLTLPVEFCYRLPSVQVAPPLDDVGRVIDVL